MNKILWTALASALVLSACSTTGGGRMFTEAEPRTKGFTAAFVSEPNPTAPNIFVTPDKHVLVDQEPIYPPPGDQVVIYFGLAQNGLYEFLPNNGIEIHSHPDFCSTLGQFLVRCSYKRPAPGTKYHYTIKVRPVGGGPVLQDLDPTVMN